MSLFSGSGTRDTDYVDVDEVNELRPALAKKWFGPAAGRMARVGVDGTGSCFFYSLATIMDLHGFSAASHARKREIVSEFRCKFADSFDEREHRSIAKHSAAAESHSAEQGKFCRMSEWADEVMIKHAARVTGINLVFFDLHAGKAYCGVAGEAHLMGTPQPTGFVAWVKRQHFEPFARVDGEAGGELELTFLFDPARPKDAAVIDWVMDNYVTQCLLSKNREA